MGQTQTACLRLQVAWLLQLCGINVPPPKEFDDPNATLSNLLNGCRALGFVPVSYPPVKLTNGYGREVCGVLDALLDLTLERQGFTFGKPVHQPDK